MNEGMRTALDLGTVVSELPYREYLVPPLPPSSRKGFQLDCVSSLFFHQTFQSGHLVLLSVIHGMGLRGVGIEQFNSPELFGLLLCYEIG